MTTIASVAAARSAFNRYISQVEASRQYLVVQRKVIQQQTVDALVALAVIQHFGSVVAILTELSSTPGIAEYAKAQASDSAYDVAAEFQMIIAAMVSARDSLIEMFPKDVGGFLSYQKLSPDGAIRTLTFTAEQLAPAAALLDSVIAVLS